MLTLAQDDRATSITLNYTLTLAITSLLVSGVIVTGSTLIQDQRERTITNQMEVYGEQLADDLTEADRLNETLTTNGVANVTTDIPARVGAQSYRIVFRELTTDDRYELELRTDNPNITVTIGFFARGEYDFSGSGQKKLQGGSVEIVCRAGQDMEVSNA